MQTSLPNISTDPSIQLTQAKEDTLLLLDEIARIEENSKAEVESYKEQARLAREEQKRMKQQFQLDAEDLRKQMADLEVLGTQAHEVSIYES